jgi:alpha-galactosidase
LSWVVELRHHGEDLYPRLKALDDPELLKRESCRWEILQQFGYFCTESNHHDSEYLPYFRRTPALMARYGFKPRVVPEHFQGKREWFLDGAGEQADAPVGELRRSEEYTSGIIEALVTNEPYTFYGNVMNQDALIDNLPGNCCVEVLCLTDGRGVHPTRFGSLPPHLAALCRSNVAVQELAVKAVLEKDREAAFLACALDPLTAATVPLDGIRAMFDELWTAESEAGLLDWFDPRHRGPLAESCAE